MRLPFMPPIEPMLAKPSDAIPSDEGWLFEPKWDGFRALVFRDGDEVYLQSRDLKPLERYFPELPPALRSAIPERCVLDGEIVIAGPRGLDFDALLLRIHPAASRVAMLAGQTPASFVAWDLLAIDDDDLRHTPFGQRRDRLRELLPNERSFESASGERLAAAAGQPPGGAPPHDVAQGRSAVHLTPATTDARVAADWFDRFEGAGLDGVVAKRLDGAYEPGRRAMLKIKHVRSADCVVAGFRWHKNGPGTLIGSLLLGLYDAAGTLHHVGVTSSFSVPERRALVDELRPLRENAMDGHPWAHWADWAAELTAQGQRVPGATSRWNRGRDLSWEALRPERVVEVAYDHLQGDRFRHGTTFLRWRPDRSPSDCRYDQLDATPPYELQRIFGARQ
jgi:ATP-dependent DNA ligase